MPEATRVLLTGATGFVGRHLYPELVRAGFDVVCASRDPESAGRRFPDRVFRRLDVADPESVHAALQGCDAAIYLVHAMGDGGDYEAAEREAATAFRQVAEQRGVRRIVYLGGIRPSGKISKHLRSRLGTGEALRGGAVSTIELQATMIVGAGSESWRIVRDLSARLPLMLLPKWLDSRSQPIAIRDVVAAIVHAVSLEDAGSGIFELPGPEILSAKEILRRTAELRGIRPLMLGVPVVTPRLSSYWIRLVTRANRHIAEELVQGLTGDLVADGRGFWQRMPEHQLLSFTDSAREALVEEDRSLKQGTLAAESWIRSLAPRSAPRPAG